MEKLTDINRNQKKLALLFLIYALFILIRLFYYHDGYLWDFRVYYGAAKTYLQGLNPYDLDVLLSVQPNVAPLRYLYPPLVIYFFLPFAMLGTSAATIIYFNLKILAWMGSFSFWNKIFSFKKHLGLFLFFALLAFNSALYKDLDTGNISGFEIFGLWLAFYYLIKDKVYHFTALVVLVSTIKFFPIVFLGILLFTDHAKRFKSLLFGVGAFALFIALNFILEPTLSQYWIESVSGMMGQTSELSSHDLGGIGNANSLDFIQSLLMLLPLESVRFPALILYTMLSVSLILISWRRLKKLYWQNPQHRLHILFTAVLLGILIMPRFKDYTYVLAVLPAYYLITQPSKNNNTFLWMILICLSTINLSTPIFKEIQAFYWNYYTLILTGVLWGVGVWRAEEFQSIEKG